MITAPAPSMEEPERFRLRPPVSGASRRASAGVPTTPRPRPGRTDSACVLSPASTARFRTGEGVLRVPVPVR